MSRLNLSQIRVAQSFGMRERMLWSEGLKWDANIRLECQLWRQRYFHPKTPENEGGCRRQISEMHYRYDTFIQAPYQQCAYAFAAVLHPIWSLLHCLQLVENLGQHKLAFNCQHNLYDYLCVVEEYYISKTYSNFNLCTFYNVESTFYWFIFLL